MSEKEADTHSRNFLDYNDFRYFVRLLKRRPEIDKLHHQISLNTGKFDFPAFERFMREFQKVVFLLPIFSPLT